MSGTMKQRLVRRLVLAAAAVGIGALAWAGGADAASFVWDGATDDNWTNGPQDNSGGGFPANGPTGANWTIDAGPAGQLATPDAGSPAANMIDYLYTGHDWTINGATINEDVQVRLSGGSLNITNSDVSLLPSSANTNGVLSGLNLGQNGAATTAVFTNSTINLQRANGGGGALQVLGGSNLSLVNSTVNLSSETALGNLGISNANSSVVMDATSVLNMDGDLTFNGNDASLTSNGGAVTARSLTATTLNNLVNLNGGSLSLGANTSGNSLQFTNAGSTVNAVGADVDMAGTLQLTNPGARYNMDGGTLDANIIQFNISGGTPQDLVFDFLGGAVTVNDANALRGSAFEGAFNWTGDAGSGTVVQTNNTNANTALARKTFQGFFSIDGTRINPTTDPTVGTLADLNTELLSLAVNGKYFEITEDTGAGTQTLSLLSLITAIDGDYNDDGSVDQGDLDLVLLNWGDDASQTGVPAGWVNMQPTGLIGQTELDGVLLNWGSTAEATGSAVPEPASAALVIAGMSGLSLRLRRG